MSNFASVYLLARSGAFKGLFDADFGVTKTVVYGVEDAVQRIKKTRHENAEKDWSAPLDRFADAPFHSSLVENYLKGGSKLIWNTNSDMETTVEITTQKGKKVSFQGSDLKADEASQYRDFAEKKLEMIEPPSFLEKLMIANKTLAASKSGKIASAASLGTVPAAVGLVAMSARAYGATRDFVMNKLNLKDNSKDKNKKSFKERLSDIKQRAEYKQDLKNLSGIENVLQNVEAKKQEKKEFLEKESQLKSLSPEQNNVKDGVATSQQYQKLIKISDHPNLAAYLEGALQIYSDAKASQQYVYQATPDSKQDLNKTGFSVSGAEKMTSSSIEPHMARYSKALEMIEPPTKTELHLLKQLYQLNHSKQKNVSERQPLVEAIAKTVDVYMTEKQKENKDFNKTHLMARLNDVRKRSIIDERLQKMVDLHSALKKNGR